MREIEWAKEMDPTEYQVVFRPKFTRLLGKLKATQPLDDKVAARHAELVNDLQAVLDEFDNTMGRIASGDLSGAEQAVKRLNTAWADTIQSNTTWLITLASRLPSEAHDASLQSAQDAVGDAAQEAPGP